ncbi:MAG: 4Fe-4S dicluster domain-containing protein [Deferribacteraceae bacterium]|jgi:anaerobic dimethyl sulfoxide reductase subunit B (iron-sulfur subunit)|nr:4Fe-4S dicluster domain-containing protein [Deferribacteraceae bacterium]
MPREASMDAAPHDVAHLIKTENFMQYAFYYDQSRCIGCNACTVACKDYNQVNPGAVRWRNQQNHENGKSVFENLSMSCNHCEEPVCVSACEVGAIEKMDNGIVLIDRHKCENLQACLMMCPFSAPQIANDGQEPTQKEAWKIAHPAQKCTFCWERLQDSLAPACVGACPVFALDCGDLAELQKKYPDAVRMNATDFPYAYQNENETKPAFLIKRRKDIKVSEFK